MTVPLPHYANPHGVQQPSDLGESTKNAQAPHFAVAIPQQDWFARSDSVLHEIERDFQAKKDRVEMAAIQKARADRKSEADQRRAGQLAAAKIVNDFT